MSFTNYIIVHSSTDKQNLHNNYISAISIILFSRSRWLILCYIFIQPQLFLLHRIWLPKWYRRSLQKNNFYVNLFSIIISLLKSPYRVFSIWIKTTKWYLRVLQVKHARSFTLYGIMKPEQFLIAGFLLRYTQFMLLKIWSKYLQPKPWQI